MEDDRKVEKELRRLALAEARRKEEERIREIQARMKRETEEAARIYGVRKDR